MKDIKRIIIKTNASIKEALKVISDGEAQIALVVDENKKLIGTLTDGDIRTGLLKGLSLNSTIQTIYFKKPIVVKKDYSKKELFKIAIANKIHQIPVINKFGKVIDIHILDDLIRPKLKTNKVVIMAGGRGTRLRPLTKDIPKPMLKVGDKPILQTIIEKFKESGYENFIICVNYKSKIIMQYFKDGARFGVNIEYIKEKTKMGTVGALSLLKKKPKEPFFVMNGDLLTNLNFDKMLDFHNYYGSKATMCITECNINSPYGEVRLENENIKSIEEKPIRKVFVNAGVYVLDPNCKSLIPKKKYYDMPVLFKKMINKNLKVISFPLGEYWLDIGKLNDFKKANEEYNLMI